MNEQDIAQSSVTTGQGFYDNADMIPMSCDVDASQQDLFRLGRFDSFAPFSNNWNSKLTCEFFVDCLN